MPSLTVLGAFVVAVVLHSLWDIINSLGSATLTQFVFVIIGNIVIAGISLTLVIRRLREARRLLIDTVPSSQ